MVSGENRSYKIHMVDSGADSDCLCFRLGHFGEKRSIRWSDLPRADLVFKSKDDVVSDRIRVTDPWLASQEPPPGNLQRAQKSDSYGGPGSRTEDVSDDDQGTQEWDDDSDVGQSSSVRCPADACEV